MKALTTFRTRVKIVVAMAQSSFLNNYIECNLMLLDGFFLSLQHGTWVESNPFLFFEFIFKYLLSKSAKTSLSGTSYLGYNIKNFASGKLKGFETRHRRVFAVWFSGVIVWDTVCLYSCGICISTAGNLFLRCKYAVCFQWTFVVHLCPTCTL